MSKHTKGPWHTKREGFSTVYVEARVAGWIQEVAACGPTAYGPEQQDANARLIAAAPDLLEALMRCKFDSLNMNFDDLAFCRAAIAKATGENHANT